MPMAASPQQPSGRSAAGQRARGIPTIKEDIVLRRLIIGVACTGVLLAAGCDSSSSTGGGGTGTNTNPEGFLYVPNQADSTMYIYDTKTMVRVDSFAIPMDEPHFVTFDHNLQYYYLIGRKAPGQIAKYQASNDSLITVVSVPGNAFPTACAISGNNDTLYMTDFTLGDNGRTHRYDISGANLVWRDSVLQAGQQTHDIRISGSKRLVISAGFSSDDITILDLQTGDVQPLTLDTARLGFNPTSNNYGPYGVLIDGNNTLAVIACRKGVDQLRLVDLVNLKILDSIPIPVTVPGNAVSGPTYMVIHPVNNNIVFVTNYTDNTVSVVRLSTREVLETLNFATPKPFGIAISDDGSRVYVTCTNTRPATGRVYVIDGNTYAKLDSLDVGSEPFGLAWRAP